MKKLILSLSLLSPLAISATADEYPYITFETLEGAKSSVPVTSDLQFSFANNTLTIASQTFALDNLSMMYFSTTEQSVATSIHTVKQITENASDIYTLDGRKIIASQMQKGETYIVKSNNGTNKLMVK